MPVMRDGNAASVGGTYSDWRGHVIVCGLPGVGLRIVEELTLSGVPAVVVDDDPDPPLARQIGNWGVPLITGTRAEEALTSAGLAGAVAVICAQDNDLRTLETALLARSLREDVRVVAQLATPAELRATAAISYSERARSSARPHTARRSVAGYLRDVAMSLLRAADRRLAGALGALVAVLVAATLILRFTYQFAGPGHHISVLDALYFTTETVTTVGYGDYSFRGEPSWLVVFAVLLMMTGALFVAVFFALLTNTLVSRRIEESLGRRKITGLRGHVLVIGLGTVGLRVAQQLHAAGRDVVVVEMSEHNRHLGQVRALGVPVVIGDATLPEVLRSVRLPEASAVAVLTSDDLANLETGLAVRDQLGAHWETTPVVLRIFDPQLAHSVRDTFGFKNVRSTAALAAPWFTGAALGLDVLSTFYAGDEPLLVARLTVTPDGGLHGLKMFDLAARTRVLAIRRAADRTVLEHLPRRTTRFQPADEAFLIGPYEELLTVLRRDRPSPQVASGTEVSQPGID
jgi:Trk K+ transport system NAD-binding subunit